MTLIFHTISKKSIRDKSPISHEFVPWRRFDDDASLVSVIYLGEFVASRSKLTIGRE